MKHWLPVIALLAFATGPAQAQFSLGGLTPEQERQLAVGQLAGTAAHQLGQPLSAILLNCYLIEQLPKNDPKFIGALAAIKSDTKRMSDLINQLRSVKASDREGYFGGTEILKLKDD